MLGYCEEFQATPGYGLCCSVMGMELFAKLEDDLPSVVCVADQLQCNSDANGVIKEEMGETVASQKLQVLVGNREWLKQNGYEVTSEVETIITENEMTGQTVVLAGIEGSQLVSYSHCWLIILYNRCASRTDSNGRYNQTRSSCYSVHITEEENERVPSHW